jgi:Ca2+ transporting ATPase
MSDRRNIIDIQKNTPQDEQSSQDSEEGKYNVDFGFGITPQKLESIMGKYKERGTDFKDLLYFQKRGGVNQLINQLVTSETYGIKSLNGREEYFGSNKVFVEPVPPFCYYVWESLSDMMVRILIVCAVVQIVLGCTLSEDPSKDWVDGVSIIVAILVVVLVGSITNYQKETKFHELNEVQNEGTKYTIIRNGNPGEYVSDDILVGDLIGVNYGDIMAADCLLVEGNGIKMDESALTGESDAMKKEPYQRCIEILNSPEGKNKVPSPLILSGTNCIEGSGKAIVLAVGDHSQKGIIRRTVDNAQENSKTPLEEKLEDIAGMIGYFGLGAGIVTLVALFIRFGISFSDQMKEYDKDSKIESIMTYYLFNFPTKIIENDVKGNTDNDLTDPKSMVAKNILDIIILCISIIVVAIPEGLPLAVTLSLAFSIKKLMDYNNLVRKMHACETMGGANYICTDKTGTLTRNEMSVFKVLTGNKEITLDQNLELEVGLNQVQRNDETVRQLREDHAKYFTNEDYWNLLRTAIALNVDCTITKYQYADINGDREKCETKNKTDKAFIEFLYRFKSPISIEKEHYLEDPTQYKQFPFDSKRKRMTTFITSAEFPSNYRLFSKGGGENASKFCNSYMDPSTGKVKPFDSGMKRFIEESIENFNKDRLRSLYIAYKDLSQDEYVNSERANDEGKLIDQHDLVFLGVFGIRDSLRDGVKEAVFKCHEAGVNVIMVTGDNIVTATAIAKECNILGPEVDLKKLGPNEIEQDPEAMNDNMKRANYINELLKNKPRAITGNSFYTCVGGLICEVCQKDTNLCKCPKTAAEAKELANRNGEEPKPVKKDVIRNMDNFKAITNNLNVMARSQPLHKYALVLGLRTLKNVVAVTGDGTNDAPALSKSDVGFAMFAGTDIAKEASDIVIIDNNFSSIVTAIIYGRNIYDNIRKFLQFQLSVNFCACLIVFICACIGNETPLTPIQMLWVNLIMDSLGSLALATEPPYEELLKRAPTKRNESIINGRMWKHITIQSLIQIIILLILYLIAPEFVKEQDLVRRAENIIIKYCYDKLPGDGDVDHIIYGTESSWSAGTKLKTNIDKIYCGGYASRQSLSVAYKEYSNDNDGSVHMTLIFNVFVIYTLFNQINCRMIDDSVNIFKRMERSILFPIITICELALQVLIVLFGKNIFHVANRGLTGEQWGICFGFSAITFVVSFIVKWIPLEKCIDKCLAPEEEKTSEKKKKTVQNTEHSTNDSSDEPKKLYDQALPVEARREREERDILKLSQNSSTFSKKENEEL